MKQYKEKLIPSSDLPNTLTGWKLLIEELCSEINDSQLATANLVFCGNYMLLRYEVTTPLGE